MATSEPIIDLDDPFNVVVFGEQQTPSLPRNLKDPQHPFCEEQPSPNSAVRIRTRTGGHCCSGLRIYGEITSCYISEEEEEGEGGRYLELEKSPSGAKSEDSRGGSKPSLMYYIDRRTWIF